MLVDITVYLYESPCSLCNVAVIRRIRDIEIIGLYRSAYPGGLDAWTDSFSNDEAEEILSSSIDEVGGLLDCPGCVRFDIDVTSSEYRPACPPAIIDSYRRIKNGIDRRTASIDRKENEAAILESIEEPTDNEIRKLRTITNEINKLVSANEADEERLAIFREQCPNVEELI